MKDKALLALTAAYLRLTGLLRDQRGQSHALEIFGGLVVAGLLITALFTQVPAIRQAIISKINCAINTNCQ